MWIQFKFFFSEFISSNDSMWSPRSILLRIWGVRVVLWVLLRFCYLHFKTNQVITVTDLYSEQNVCPSGQGS